MRNHTQSIEKGGPAISRKDNNFGAGLIGLLAIGGLLAFARHKVEESQDTCERRQAEEQKRKNTPCMFNNGISEDDFSQLAIKICKKIKRVNNVSVQGPCIYGDVESQSGLSTWSFSIDFNDYGHITGKHWITSENSDSYIPHRIGELISQAVSSNINSEVYDNAYDATDQERCSSVRSIPPTKLLRKNKKLKFRRFFAVLLILCVAGISIYHCWMNYYLISVGFSSSDPVGKHYQDVVNSLTDAGFTQISINELNDLDYTQIEYDGTVEYVSINGETTYFSAYKYPFDAEIVVTYHSLRYISAPITSKEAKGLPYATVQEAFIAAGFGNIILEPKESIILSWFSKEGTVTSVSINQKSNYSSKDLYRSDAEITITYHTRKP